MNYSIEELIAIIPSLDSIAFNQLAGAVFARMNNQPYVRPLDADQWAEKLNHSLAQAKLGEKTDASTLTSRIREMDR